MRRVGLLVFAMLLVGGFLPAIAADPSPSVGATAGTNGGVDVTVATAGSAGTSAPGDASSPMPAAATNGPVTIYVSICGSDAGTPLCTGIGGCAAGTDPYEAYTAPNAGDTPTPSGTITCLADNAAPPTGPTDGQLSQAATANLPLVNPTPVIQPAPTTLVNLPTLIYAGDDQHTIVRDLTIEGTDVTVTATPHFTWTLPDATPATIDTDNPGLRYDGTSPLSDPAHYLTATWTTTGTRTLSLTTAWHVRIVIKKTGRPITLTQPILHTGTVALTVKQASSILTGNS